MHISQRSYFFYHKLQYQTINFFVFESTNNSKMDNFSLLQTIERIPELEFKYMGSYTADKTPRPTKDSSAIINSVPSNDRGKHRIRIARMDKTYCFADSFGGKRSTNSFLTKKYRRMIPQKLQKFNNLCGFYAIYSPFLLFKFF